MLRPTFDFDTLNLPDNPDAVVALISTGGWPTSKFSGDLGSVLDHFSCEKNTDYVHVRAREVDHLIQIIIRDAELSCPESFDEFNGYGYVAAIIGTRNGDYVLDLTISWHYCDADILGYRTVPKKDGKGFRIEPCERGERKEEG